MLKLWSSDYAALVLARAILRKEPKVELQIFLGGEQPDGALCMTDFRFEALNSTIEKYPRVAVISNQTEDLVVPGSTTSVLTEMLEGFANRGLTDTVEFRRLARKYLRAVRNANCNAALFFSGILAEEKTQKILNQILGTQVTPVFLTEFLPAELFTPAEKQSLEIFTSENLDRVRAEAERFLHTKLAKNAVIKR